LLTFFNKSIRAVLKCLNISAFCKCLRTDNFFRKKLTKSAMILTKYAHFLILIAK
jgi:hypothetical protein